MLSATVRTYVSSHALMPFPNEQSGSATSDHVLLVVPAVEGPELQVARPSRSRPASPPRLLEVVGVSAPPPRSSRDDGPALTK